MGTIQINRFGRVLIPKPICEELSLKPNSTLEMRLVDGEILLRPKLVGEIVEHDGVFVWTGSDNLEYSNCPPRASTRFSPKPLAVVTLLVRALRSKLMPSQQKPLLEKGLFCLLEKLIFPQKVVGL